VAQAKEMSFQIKEVVSTMRSLEVSDLILKALLMCIKGLKTIYGIVMLLIYSLKNVKPDYERCFAHSAGIATQTLLTINRLLGPRGISKAFIFSLLTHFCE